MPVSSLLVQPKSRPPLLTLPRPCPCLCRLHSGRFCALTAYHQSIRQHISAVCTDLIGAETQSLKRAVVLRARHQRHQHNRTQNTRESAFKFCRLSVCCPTLIAVPPKPLLPAISSLVIRCVPSKRPPAPECRLHQSECRRGPDSQARCCAAQRISAQNTRES